MTPVSESDLVLFLGRFHPTLVHFPIGLVLLLCGLELVAWVPRFRRATSANGYILAFAVPTSIGAAVCGWMLSREGGYDATLLQRHQVLGFGVAGGVVATAVCYAGHWRRSYLGALGITAVLLVLGSHLGGTLTHGSDYLTRHAPYPLRHMLRLPPVKSGGPAPQAASEFQGAVQPLLDRYCVECHGPEKNKGKLRLDTLEQLRAGGAGGAVVVAGSAADSPLLQRVRLPEDHDDHMPPGGKPQPTEADVNLLERWIQQGAHGP